MKFIHCADIHLNSRIDSLPTPKAKIRREEIMRSFEKLCAYAVENEVTAVILAGDIFDTNVNGAKVRERFLHAIKTSAPVDFLYLNGNHDEGKIFDENDVIPENLKFFKDEWTTFSYGNTDIVGVNFTAYNSEIIYASLNLNPNRKNVVVMHGQTAAYNASDGFYVVNLPKLKDKNVDYLALGHIHQTSINKLDNRGVYAYCGALDGRGFDELGVKGFYLLTVEDNKVVPEFIEFSSRIIAEYTFNVENYTDFFTLKDDVFNTLKKDLTSDSLVKVILKGERQIDFNLDINSLNFLLNENFFFAKIDDKTELIVKKEDYLLDKSVRGEFVRAVLSGDLTEEMKKKVIQCGLNALKGEELL